MTLVPCSHVMYAIYALGVVTKKTAYVDLGQDPGFTGEHLQEVVNM